MLPEHYGGGKQPMKLLGIDTTGTAASVALIDEHMVIAEMSTNYEKNHSVTLMPMIENLFKSVEHSLTDVDYIACSSGPGSFTGLRIGVATAKALAHGAKRKIVPVPTLDALAYNLYARERIIVPIMNARRNQVYTAFYRYNGLLERLTDYIAEDFDKVLEMLKEYDTPPVFLGDGVLAYGDKLAAGCFEIAPPHVSMQRGAAVASLGLVLANNGEAVGYDEFEPFYLRKPQAEREYCERTKNENN